MGIDKKSVGVVIGLAGVLGLGVVSAQYADIQPRARTFSMTIPAVIPVMQDSTGTTIIAKTARLQNNGNDDVVVKSMKLVNGAGYTIGSQAQGSLPGDTFNISVNGTFANDGTGIYDGIQPKIVKGQSTDLNLGVKAGKFSKGGNLGRIEYEFAWNVVGIQITKKPDKLEYNEGESFDKTGIVVETVLGTGGTGERVENITITDGDSLTNGQTSVTVQGVVNGQTFEATIDGITVNRKMPPLNATNQIGRVPFQTALRDLTGHIKFVTIPYNGSGGIDVSEKQDRGVIAVIEGQNATIYADGGSLAFNMYRNTSVKPPLENTTGMFEYFKCSSIDFFGLDFSKITDGSEMFESMDNITEIDLGGKSFESMEKACEMFGGLNQNSRIQRIVFGRTSNKLNDTYNMFYRCVNLTDLDISEMDTSGVKNMGGMFSQCSKLVNVTGFDRIDTSSVVEFDFMFAQSGFKNLDLSHFDTSNAYMMRGMLANCKSLTGVDVSSFITEQVEDFSSMFYGCDAITSLDLSSFDIFSIRDTRKLSTNSSIVKDFAKFDKMFDLMSPHIEIFTRTYADKMHIAELGVDSLSEPLEFRVKSVSERDKLPVNGKNIIDVDKWRKVCSENTNGYGYVFERVPYIRSEKPDGINIIDISYNRDKSVIFVKNDRYNSIFADGGIQLQDTSKSGNGLFSGLYKLNWSQLVVDGVNMDGVTDISSMFKGVSFGHIKLIDFDTSRVTNMSSMFREAAIYGTDGRGSKAILNINGRDGISGLNTSSVTDMSYMFYEVSRRHSGMGGDLDVSGLDMSNVENAKYMFRGTSLSPMYNLDLSSIKANKLTETTGMFSDMANITELDLTGFNFDAVTQYTAQSMFLNCRKLDVVFVSKQEYADMLSKSSGCPSTVNFRVRG